MRRPFGLLLVLAGCGGPLPAYTPLVREPAGRELLTDAGPVLTLRESENASAEEATSIVFAMIEGTQPRVRAVFERVKARVQKHAKVVDVMEEPDGGVIRYATPAAEGSAEIRLKSIQPGKSSASVRFRETPRRAR